jgi:hypothetical protein
MEVSTSLIEAFAFVEVMEESFVAVFRAFGGWSDISLPGGNGSRDVGPD